MYKYTRRFFFFNKIYKKALYALQNSLEKIVFITKSNEKNCLKHIFSETKKSANPKNSDSLDKKNNSPFLTIEKICYETQYWTLDGTYLNASHR